MCCNGNFGVQGLDPWCFQQCSRTHCCCAAVGAAFAAALAAESFCNSTNIKALSCGWAGEAESSKTAGGAFTGTLWTAEPKPPQTLEGGRPYFQVTCWTAAVTYASPCSLLHMLWGRCLQGLSVSQHHTRQLAQHPVIPRSAVTAVQYNQGKQPFVASTIGVQLTTTS